MPFCCCQSPEEVEARNRKNAGPPGNQSMRRDRGSNDHPDMDEDTKAVAWLRKRELERQEQQQNTEEPLAERTQSFDNSLNRLQERNPLEKPYAMHDRETPLRPHDGNILHMHPSIAATPTKKPHNIETTPSTVASEQSSTNMEIFRPQVGSSPNKSLEMGPAQNYEDESIEQMSIVAESDFMSEEGGPDEMQSPSPGRSSLNVDNVRRGGKKSSRNVTPETTKFVEIGGLMIPQAAQGIPRKDYGDHLSDVPSDVDSVTKERYLLACHMLKTTLIEKETALIPIEREFIMSLLADKEADGDAGSVVSEDRVSAIESAKLRLDLDPLFQGPTKMAKSSEMLSPMTAASLANKKRESEQKPQAKPWQQIEMQIQKNPHTATRPPRRSFQPLFNPCSTRVVDEPKTDVMLILQEDEDGEGEQAPELYSSQQVRYDGWSLQKQAEYPFSILGAEDVRVQPRVLTPSIMEALRGFFPYNSTESNFWLKFSLVRDGASLATLLSSVRASAYTIIGVETEDGEVFGSFTGSPWRTGTKWFGSGEAFLWRLKKSRITSSTNSHRSNFENEMEVYPFTGYDDLVQYCTPKTMAIGGGNWIDIPCPFDNEPRGVGFMIDGDLAGGETNSCATFGNPRLSKRASASNEFTISNLEVWTLTPCLTVKEAEKLEVQKLFVEENRR
jgi:hypothetical protein